MIKKLRKTLRYRTCKERCVLPSLGKSTSVICQNFRAGSENIIYNEELQELSDFMGDTGSDKVTVNDNLILIAEGNVSILDINIIKENFVIFHINLSNYVMSVSFYDGIAYVCRNTLVYNMAMISIFMSKIFVKIHSIFLMNIICRV